MSPVAARRRVVSSSAGPSAREAKNLLSLESLAQRSPATNRRTLCSASPTPWSVGPTEGRLPGAGLSLNASPAPIATPTPVSPTTLTASRRERGTRSHSSRAPEAHPFRPRRIQGEACRPGFWAWRGRVRGASLRSPLGRVRRRTAARAALSWFPSSGASGTPPTESSRPSGEKSAGQTESSLAVKDPGCVSSHRGSHLEEQRWRMPWRLLNRSRTRVALDRPAAHERGADMSFPDHTSHLRRKPGVRQTSCTWPQRPA